MNNGLNIFRYLAQKHTCASGITKSLNCEFCKLQREAKDLSALYKVSYHYNLSCTGDKKEIIFCNDSGDCLLEAYKKSLNLNLKDRG
jgi:hypothetical protein